MTPHPLHHLLRLRFLLLLYRVVVAAVLLRVQAMIGMTHTAEILPFFTLTILILSSSWKLRGRTMDCVQLTHSQNPNISLQLTPYYFPPITPSPPAPIFLLLPPPITSFPPSPFPLNLTPYYLPPPPPITSSPSFLVSMGMGLHGTEEPDPFDPFQFRFASSANTPMGRYVQ